MNRTQRLNFFLVVWLTMFSCISSRGQKTFAESSNPEFSRSEYVVGVDFKGAREPLFPLVKTKKEPAGAYFYLSLNNSNLQLTSRQSTYNQPANLCYIQSGYFCKREWELEKKTRIPFRFRLGSLADCNAMEWKHN